MQESLNKIKALFTEQWDKIKDSDTYHDLKAKYDELDPQVKTKINLGVLGGITILILITVLTGVSKVSNLKNEFSEREAVINYLLDSEDVTREDGK